MCVCSPCMLSPPNVHDVQLRGRPLKPLYTTGRGRPVSCNGLLAGFGASRRAAVLSSTRQYPEDAVKVVSEELAMKHQREGAQKPDGGDSVPRP